MNPRTVTTFLRLRHTGSLGEGLACAHVTEAQLDDLRKDLAHAVASDSLEDLHHAIRVAYAAPMLEGVAKAWDV